jgi:hypothetical protein
VRLHSRMGEAACTRWNMERKMSLFPLSADKVPPMFHALTVTAAAPHVRGLRQQLGGTVFSSR